MEIVSGTTPSPQTSERDRRRDEDAPYRRIKPQASMPAPVRPKLLIEHVSYTKNTGFPRVNNDFIGVYTSQFGKLYIVSRGVGAEGAELLAHLSVITIKDAIKNFSEETENYMAIQTAIDLATHEVAGYISKHEWLKNCGATIALLLTNSKGICIAHSGDCRILLLRKGKIITLTEDHFIYQESAKIERKEPENPINTLGLSNVEAEIKNIRLYKNDKIFLITKGVYQRVTRQDMVKAFFGKNFSTSLKKLWEYAQDKKSVEDFSLIALRVLKSHFLLTDEDILIKEKKMTVYYVLLLLLSLILLFMVLYPYILDFWGV